MPHSFFLSYARRDAREDGPGSPADQHFTTFLQRLQKRVTNITGAPGFVDTSDIKSGMDWPDELAEALRSTPTLVCLYSPSYFLSETCGKEMQIFLNRRKDYIDNNAGKRPSNIIPVLWHSTPRRIPKTLPQIQYQCPELDPSIHGAWDLGDLGRTRDLEVFADTIAFRVRDAAEETPLPNLNGRPRLDAVQSAFQPPALPLPEFDAPESARGPDTVTFVYASGTEWEAWPWSPPKDHAVLHLAAAIAKGKELMSSQLTFDLAGNNFSERLIALRGSNNVVVLLVDSSFIDSPEMIACLRDYDKPEYSTFSIIIVSRKEPEARLRDKINTQIPFFARRAPPHLFFAGTKDRFGDIIAEALDGLRLAIVKDPQLQDSVMYRTDFPALPGISGPGQLKGKK